jgi:uncharacterized protein YfaS (alpha-2-macroglobulin family)
MLAFTVRRFFCLLVLSLALTACDRTSEDKASQGTSAEAAQWGAHIADYPKRWVATDAPLFIRFTHPVVDQSQLNQPRAKLVSLSPKLPVTAVFTAVDELRITPHERLPGDQTLSVQLHNNKLLGVDGDLPPFVFEVHTIKQDFDLKINGLVSDANNSEQMLLQGQITTTDRADAKAVEKILRATLQGKTVPLLWQAQDDGKTFGFTLSAIARADEAGELTLAWDGSAIGSDEQGARTITVPAINQFLVTQARVVHYPEHLVEVNFSEPLDARQNLRGLVRLADQEDVRVVIDGSRLKVYPARLLTGEAELLVSSMVRSTEQKNLPQDFRQTLLMSVAKPALNFVGSSNILPPAKQISVPFEAMGVDSVQVIAFKIYANNIGQFLQRYDLDSNSADTMTGRYLWRKTYHLPEVPRDAKERFHLDLTELMAQHPDGLIRLELRVDRSNSVYECDLPRPENPTEKMPENYDREGYYGGTQEPSWYRQYYESSGHLKYSERNNPCSDAYYYYGDTTNSARTFMVSNIGLMAKRGSDNTLHVISTQLDSAAPLANARITAFNYQQQVIGSGNTDQHGMVDITTDGTPFYITAEAGKENNKKTGFLRIPRNEALPTNQFDTNGEHVKGGLKGFIYGERDVWRPGDDIFLTFILEDKGDLLPENHPVTLDLFDPRGNKVTSKAPDQTRNNFYTFTLRTDEAAPTGNWRAVIHVGNRYFDKVLKVETIVPNRLKVDLIPSQTPLHMANMPAQVDLFGQWLHGATASNLKADSEVKLRSKTTRFAGFDQFNFDDPARTFAGSTQKVFEGKLNSEGRSQFPLNLQVESPPPGLLSATFITRVFEQSGNFSTTLRSFDVFPYQNWVGLSVPKGDGYHDAIGRDSDHAVNFVALNSDGKALANRALDVTVYEIGWRWWWDQESENLANYVGNRHHTPVSSAQITTDEQGRAQWTLTRDTYQWGRHLIRVCDAQGSHCAGKIVYLGWSWSEQKNPDSATQLMLTTDKENYRVGETAIVRLPANSQGRVLLSLENGSKVLEHRWLDLEPGQTEISIPISAAMAPSTYVNISLLLPHQQRETDAPMRLYGIVPLLVEDPQTRLQPQIDVPEEVRPETEFTVKVSEPNQRTMTYTLAIVDEGLLGLTGFRVPDAHEHFYRREALGVLTWDMFDQVVGAYGASLERVLAIGGSDADPDAESKNRERRFPPVVKFMGPFTLATGATDEHKITLPPYMGAVRVMVVAGDNAKAKTRVNAYGKTEQSIKVTQPLVLLATLPRVVGPGEEVNVPVNIFVSDAAIKNVDVSIETNDTFTRVDQQTTLTFDNPGDAITHLRLKVNDRIGKGRVLVTARSGDEVATQEIFIESRAPNPATVIRESKLLAPGEQWQSPLTPHGMAGTNETSVEVSTLPPINLQQRLGYLIDYPHGCLEQITSAAFPQLYLAQLVTLSDQQKADVDTNVAAAINKLVRFQQSGGAFSYWPGDGFINEWASSYSGHFLLEAKKAGHAVPSEVLSQWVNHQQNLARNYRGARYAYDLPVAAYRLYTLVLADQAELPAMNRLREQLRQETKNSHSRKTASWMLGLAYHHLGLTDAATDVLGQLNGEIPSYEQHGYTYGSLLRDRSLLLITLLRSGQIQNDLTWQVAEQIAAELSSDSWLSTQSLSWALIAMSEFSQQMHGDDAMKFSLKTAQANDWQSLSVDQTFYQQKLNQSDVWLRNDSDHDIRVMVSNRGIPASLQEQASNDGLVLSAKFFTLDGDPLSVESLPQGTDFVAEVSVSADFSRLPGKHVENLALTLVMPSGWQIRNERIEGEQLPKGLDYMDIRDDRMLSYFSLWHDYSWSYRYNDRYQPSVTVRVILNASYAGKFYLPAWQVTAMYNEKIHAKTRGYWVEVVEE